MLECMSLHAEAETQACEVTILANCLGCQEHRSLQDIAD